MIATELLLADLQRVAREEGDYTSLTYDMAGQYSSMALVRRFGGWNAAVQSAGLPVLNSGRTRKGAQK